MRKTILYSLLATIPIFFWSCSRYGLQTVRTTPRNVQTELKRSENTLPSNAFYFAGNRPLILEIPLPDSTSILLHDSLPAGQTEIEPKTEKQHFIPFTPLKTFKKDTADKKPKEALAKKEKRALFWENVLLVLGILAFLSWFALCVYWVFTDTVPTIIWVLAGVATAFAVIGIIGAFFAGVFGFFDTPAR